MHCFYMYLKDHTSNIPVMQKEQDIAAARAPLTLAKESEMENVIDAKSKNIKNAFLKQQEHAAVRLSSWTQSFHS